MVCEMAREESYMGFSKCVISESGKRFYKEILDTSWLRSVSVQLEFPQDYSQFLVVATARPNIREPNFGVTKCEGNELFHNMNISYLPAYKQKGRNLDVS